MNKREYERRLREIESSYENGDLSDNQYLTQRAKIVEIGIKEGHEKIHIG